MHTHIYSFNNKCLCIAYYVPNTVLLFVGGIAINMEFTLIIQNLTLPCVMQADLLDSILIFSFVFYCILFLSLKNAVHKH